MVSDDHREEHIMMANRSSPISMDTTVKASAKWRNLVAYWILGLCNNYGYVVMLSAAADMLEESKEETKQEKECNPISTGAILLADIIPSLVVKFVSPFLPFYIHIRVAVCVILATTGFLLVAFSQEHWVSLTGVVITSLSSGLGEVSYLQYSSFYDKNVVSTWSSGTGGAGVFGALSYVLLQKLGLRTALLIMLTIPALMAVAFWGILTKPVLSETLKTVHTQINLEEVEEPLVALKKKLAKIPGLMKYMIPLFLVYLFEYFINQGMFELIAFDGEFLDKKEQYRWLQVDYQIGVFISRSSVNLLYVKHIWIMSVFQAINVVLFTTQAIYSYIPAFWIILILTLWEGLLGGSAYVNTFYKISKDVPEEDKQFSMATTSFADTIGITLAGVLAIVAHNEICDYFNS